MSTLTGLLLILLSSAGHVELWVLIVNRTHSFRIDYRILRTFRFLHDVAVLAYPAVLVFRYGTGPNGLLTGGRFSDQPVMLQWILLGTSLGVIPLIAGVLRWHLRQKKEFAAADSAERHSLRKLAAADPAIGDLIGTCWSVARHLPFNQFLTVEINRKTIRVSAEMSASMDTSRPLRIVHISDLHFIGTPGEGYYRWVFQQIASINPDAIMFTGDLIDDPKLLPMAVDCLKSVVPVAPCFFILGNHDWRFDHEEIRRAVIDAGWTNLAGVSQMVTLAGRQVMLGGTEYPWIGQHPPVELRSSGSAAGDHSQKRQGQSNDPSARGEPDAIRILLSHSPDQIRFAKKSGFHIMLSGHTHGGQVVLPVIGPVYSPSIYGVRYASGLFDSDWPRVHVSRGMAGKDCLRIGATPEITCLEIH